MHVHTALGLLFGLVLAPQVGADVFVVDPAGGPGASLLQAALDAAQPGDILLLREGDYSTPVPASVIGKGLTVVADAGHTVILPAFRGESVPEGQLLLVDGLLIEPPSDGAWDALFLLSGAGVTWVQDCEARGLDAWPDVAALQGGPLTLSGQPGLTVVGTGMAVISRSMLRGGRGLDAQAGPGGEAFPATAGGNGVSANVARLVALHAQGHGGDGGSGEWQAQFAANGGNGLAAIGGRALLYGEAFHGGDEWEAVPGSTQPGAGAAFALETVFLRDVLLQAGAVHGDGTPVPDLNGMFSTVATWPAPVRVLSSDSPVREFGSAGVALLGQPGDLAWLFVSTAPGALELPGKQGWWLLSAAPAPLPLLLGAITDPTGQLDLQFAVPALPGGEDGRVLFLQLAVVDAQGQVLLGTASALTWISAAY